MSRDTKSPMGAAIILFLITFLLFAGFAYSHYTGKKIEKLRQENPEAFREARKSAK